MIVVGASTRTVTVAVALTEPDVAVIVAVPSPTDVTAPDDDTVATAALDVDHVTVGLLIVVPFWSTTVAVSCCVDPAVENERLVGDSVIVVGIVNVTVTDAVALTEPEVAVIVAVPAPTDVTEPDADTVATPVFDDVHVTGASLIVAPFWSLTMTASCCVDPAVVNDRLVGDIVIDEAMRSMIVRLYVWLPVSPPLATVMVNWYVAPVVGVPVMDPSDEKFRPGGNSPAVFDQL